MREFLPPFLIAFDNVFPLIKQDVAVSPGISLADSVPEVCPTRRNDAESFVERWEDAVALHAVVL